MDYSSIRYNFIIGHGRGGTTLLLYILNAHPQIYGLPEFKNILLTDNVSSEKEFKKITEKYLRRLEQRSFLAGLPQTFKERKVDEDIYQSAFEKGISKRERYIRLALSINKVYDIPSRNKNLITHIIHKVPYYTFYVDEILKIFPEAKFIINIRDPRAQNYSHIKRHSTERLFLGKNNPEGRSVLWNFYAQETLKLLEKYPDKCYLFQYEKFVENPHKTMYEILEFLGVPYDESIWNYHIPVKNFLEQCRNYLSENKIKKYLPLSMPVTTEYKDDWKKMNPKDIQIIENICKESMIKLGYEFICDENKRISLLSKVKVYFYTIWYWIVIKSYIAKSVHRIYQLYFF